MKKNLELLTSGLSLSRQILWPLGTYYFCLWKSLVEPLYGYLRTSISWCVFYQIGSFQAKSSELPRMVMLPFSSAQPKWQQKGENKQSKTLNKKYKFWQVSLPLFRDLHCQTWLKLQCDHHVNLWNLGFFSSDSENFNLVGNTHTETPTYIWLLLYSL